MSTRKLEHVILQPVDKSELMAPSGAEFLSVLLPSGAPAPALVYEIDPAKPFVPYIIRIMKGGQVVPKDVGRYVGSFIMPLRIPVIFSVYVAEQSGAVDAEFSEVVSEASGETDMPGLKSSGSVEIVS